MRPGNSLEGCSSGAAKKVSSSHLGRLFVSSGVQTIRQLSWFEISKYFILRCLTRPDQTPTLAPPKMKSRTRAMQPAPSASPRTRRCTIAVNGVVQGVGFRPAVYRLAVSHRVAGTVRNSRAGVVIEVEGDEASLGAFLTALGNEAPGPVSVSWDEPEGATSFSIGISSHDGRARFSPAPDSAMC